MTEEQLNELERRLTPDSWISALINTEMLKDLIRLARVGIRIEKWKENTLIPTAIAKETTDE